MPDKDLHVKVNGFNGRATTAQFLLNPLDTQIWCASEVHPISQAILHPF
jgi:hypothetical protein